MSISSDWLPRIELSIMLAVVSTFTPGGAAAQDLTVEAPSQLRIVRPSDTDCDVNKDEALAIGGRLAGLTAQDLGRFKVYVNGHEAVVSELPTGLRYSDCVALGRDPPWWTTRAVWPQIVPYRAWFEDDMRLLLPVIVELVDTQERVAVARRRLTLRDSRPDIDLRWEATSSVIDSALGSQVTLTGIDQLQLPHESSLPHPDLARLNSDLDALVPSLSRRGRELARPGACRPLEEKREFKDLPAYGTILGLAMAQHETYEKQVDYANGLLASTVPTTVAAGAAAMAVAEKYCVKHEPGDDDFDVCVSGIDGDVVDIDVGAFGTATLLPPDLPDRLGSDITLNRIDTEIDTELVDLSIRWSSGSDNCAPRPRVQISENRIASTNWLNEWVDCPTLHFRADEARSHGPGRFSFAPYRNNSERLNVDRAERPDLELWQPEADAGNVTTCGESWVRNEVETFLIDFVSQVNQALTAAWDTRAPDTGQAVALELLLSAFDLGIRPIARADLFAAYKPAEGIPQRGLNFGWSTNVRPAATTDQARESATVYREAAKPPQWPSGEDFAGHAFDVSYTVTTGFLNQVLRALSATNRLRANIEPTWSDLGLSPPAGRSASSPAELTTRTLAKLLPPFERLPEEAIEIRVRTTLNPFVYMPPDLSREEGTYPLTFQLGQLIVEIASVRRDRGEVWLELAIDVFDPSFQLSLDPTPGATVLRATWGSPFWAYTATVNRLQKCPMKPHLMVRALADTCERKLEAIAGALVRSHLGPRLLGMLSEIPAPQWFDAQHQAQAPRWLNQKKRYQQNQLITFYGELQ